MTPERKEQLREQARWLVEDVDDADGHYITEALDALDAAERRAAEAEGALQSKGFQRLRELAVRTPYSLDKLIDELETVNGWCLKREAAAKGSLSQLADEVAKARALALASGSTGASLVPLIAIGSEVMRVGAYRTELGDERGIVQDFNETDLYVVSWEGREPVAGYAESDLRVVSTGGQGGDHE